MKMKIVVSVFLFFLGLFFVKGIFAIDSLPHISTACETKNGELYAFNDGFSLFKKCEGTSRRVVLIGEKGDTGQQGPQGEKGDQGPAGPSSNLHVLDKNGQDLGIYMNGVNNNVSYYIPSIDRVGSLQAIKKPGNPAQTDDDYAILGDQSGILFESTDCTGAPYIATFGTMRANALFALGLNRQFILNKSLIPANINQQSYLQMNPSTLVVECKQEILNFGSLGIYPLTEISLPFNVPIALPLQFKLQ